jgi:hypothetical protein
MRAYRTRFGCRGIAPLGGGGLRLETRRLTARELRWRTGIYVARRVRGARLVGRIRLLLRNRLLVDVRCVFHRRLRNRRVVGLGGQPVSPGTGHGPRRRRTHFGRAGPVRGRSARIPLDASRVRPPGRIRLRGAFRSRGGDRRSADRGGAAWCGRNRDCPTLFGVRAGRGQRGGGFHDTVLRGPRVRCRCGIGRRTGFLRRAVDLCRSILRRGRETGPTRTTGLFRRGVTEPGWRAVRAARRPVLLVCRSRCGRAGPSAVRALVWRGRIGQRWKTAWCVRRGCLGLLGPRRGEPGWRPVRSYRGGPGWRGLRCLRRTVTSERLVGIDRGHGIARARCGATDRGHGIARARSGPTRCRRVLNR